MDDKLTNLIQLRMASERVNGLIGQVAGATAEALEEMDSKKQNLDTALTEARVLELIQAAGGFSPQIIVPTVEGDVVTCASDTTSLQQTSTGDEVIFNIPDYGTWKVSMERDGKISDQINVEVDMVKRYWVTEEFSFANVYGVSWDDSSASELTRTDGSALFADPVPAVGDVAGSSPFDSLYPWSGMVRAKLSNNELVAIPKYWVKVSHNPFRVQIADKALPGYQVSPAHRDREDGKGERDVVYIGRYECNSAGFSMTGYPPKTGETIATCREYTHNRGADFWQADFALQLTLMYLYIVEFANWNAQAVIGQGNVNSSAVINTGGTDSMVYHTGRAAGTDGQTAVQYRWIENLWGNIREWRDGIVFSDDNISTYNNPADFSDEYAGTGSVVRGNKRCKKNGWIKAWDYDENDPSFIYPSEVDSLNMTAVSDYCYYTSKLRGLNVGGDYNTSNDRAGVFSLNGQQGISNSSNYIGMRIQKLP